MAKPGLPSLTAPIVLLLWAGLAGPVAAQTSATGADLTGIVLDQTDAILPETSVTVVEIDTNLTRTVSAGRNGRFAVLALVPGSYRLRAERAGFRPYVMRLESRAAGCLSMGRSTKDNAAVEGKRAHARRRGFTRGSAGPWRPSGLRSRDLPGTTGTFRRAIDGPPQPCLVAASSGLNW